MAKGFNLLDEPWIVGLTPDGREQQLSILEVFERAPSLTSLGGEVPTQGFAITRLLLAFLHRAIDGPDDQDAWAELWRADALPMDQITRYADEVRVRFDLFDAEKPFFQVADLRTANGEVSGLEKIVADVPNGEPLFTTRSARSLERIGAGEAARWLVHVQAFDPSGIKSGAVGDATVKGGKGYPIGTGWAGQLGGVLAEGVNLRQTLLLNLIARDSPYVRLGGDRDIPSWERDPDTAKRFEERPPRGAIDLYTWQARRVRLFGDRDAVTGVVLSNGDKIAPQNRHPVEPHTAWRYSDPQSKKFKDDVYMPRVHDPDRSFWRGIGALLPSVSRRGNEREAQRFLAPGVLYWISDLVGAGNLPDDYQVRLRALGAEYGAQSATYTEVMDDALPIAVLLLREDAPDAGRAADRAVKDAEEAAWRLGRFADDVVRAAGGEAGVGDHARASLYAALERPYRDWLSKLTPGCDLAGAASQWQATVRTACLSIADELVAAAPASAWMGRDVNGYLVNVPLAYHKFRIELAKVLPFAFDSQPQTQLEEPV